MTELSLFSGVGGGLLGSKLLGWTTIGYVENEPYCQKVLRQRIADGVLDAAPIFGDIRRFVAEGYAASYQGMVDVLTAGFPCPPFSVAGKKLGAKDARNMWPATAITIGIVRPREILLENVPGIRPYLPVVIRNLRRLGYVVRRPVTIAAAALGAGHIRNRVWIYAYSDEARQPHNQRSATAETKPQERATPRVANAEISTDTDEAWKLQSEGREQELWEWIGDCSWWKAEPGVVRVVYGIPNGMDRIAALGNAQVPAVVKAAWTLLTSDIVIDGRF